MISWSVSSPRLCWLAHMHELRIGGVGLSGCWSCVQVEGLDVDAHHFDKFAVRTKLAHIIEDIWGQAGQGAVALLGDGQAAAADDEVAFGAFVQSLLGDLLYLLNDSLDRLGSIKVIEDLRTDDAAWQRLQPAQRSEKEGFLASQARALPSLTLTLRTRAAPDVCLGSARRVRSSAHHQTPARLESAETSRRRSHTLSHYNAWREVGECGELTVALHQPPCLLLCGGHGTLSPPAVAPVATDRRALSEVRVAPRALLHPRPSPIGAEGHAWDGVWRRDSLQENAARGFLAMAMTTLHLMNVLTLSPTMAAKFTADGVVGRSAYAVISFLESLLGPKRAAIQVQQPEKYGFDERALLTNVVTFTLQLANTAPFLAAMVATLPP